MNDICTHAVQDKTACTMMGLDLKAMDKGQNPALRCGRI